MWVAIRSRNGQRSCEIARPRSRRSPQGLLEHAQRVDVEVVGRLVEEEQVPAGAQQLREVDTVALAAGEVGDALLLVGPAEVEPGDVLARVHLPPAELDRVLAARDLFPDVVLRIQVGPGLVDVGELDRVADARHTPASDCSSPAINRKSVVLAIRACLFRFGLSV